MWQESVTRNNLVFLRSVRQLLVTASVVPSSPILVTLTMETLSSSETSVLTTATLRNIPEDAILHSHRRENLKSYNNNYNLHSFRTFQASCILFVFKYFNNKGVRWVPSSFRPSASVEFQWNASTCFLIETPHSVSSRHRAHYVRILWPQREVGPNSPHRAKVNNSSIPLWQSRV
jgi:hypothetical protein